MKIAVLSDIHDHIWALKTALAGLQDAEALIFCGDLCSPFVLDLLAEGFPNRPIHLVFGNNDGDTFRITKNAGKHPQVTIHGEFFRAELGGRSFAANHFNTVALEMARSGQFDVVCCGHNHCYQVERVGRTLMVNPGAIMGYDPLNKKDIPSTLVLYDSETDEATGYEITVPQGSRTYPGLSKYP